MKEDALTLAERDAFELYVLCREAKGKNEYPGKSRVGRLLDDIAQWLEMGRRATATRRHQCLDCERMTLCDRSGRYRKGASSECSGFVKNWPRG